MPLHFTEQQSGRNMKSLRMLLFSFFIVSHVRPRLVGAADIASLRGNQQHRGLACLPCAGIYNINCGGPGLTDPSGTVWSADNYFMDGSIHQDTSIIPVSGAADDRLYIDERYGAFSYEIPISAGSYEVSLLFAESRYVLSFDQTNCGHSNCCLLRFQLSLPTKL